MQPFYLFFSIYFLISELIVIANIFQIYAFASLAFLETKKQHFVWRKSVVAEGKCKGMSRRHEGFENGRRRKSTRQREAKINGFVLSAFFQAF